MTSTPEDLLVILAAQKLFDGTAWRSVDTLGATIPDPDNALQKGVHGALLMAQAQQTNIFVLLRRRLTR